MATRRAFVTGCAAAALSATLEPARAAEPGLGALAARSGRFFGSAVAGGALDSGATAYRRLLETECSVWVPEWQLKWGALAPTLADTPDFSLADAIVAAASKQGKRLRGHALVWHEHLPRGVEELETPRDFDRVVAGHVRSVAARYGEAIFQWDVVNEAIEPRDGGADLMRRTPFYRMAGPDYVAQAFHLAHEAAPKARLYLNDYAVCYAEPWQERRRTGLLRLLERLIAAGAPVHGLGIQGHLDIRHRFEERVFARFLAEVAGMGLELSITELDVREADAAGGLDIAARRGRVAGEVRRVLAVALDNPALKGVVTWGLADSESWLRKTYPIANNQGLPYDDELRPTPMRDALAALFAAARRSHDD